MVSRRTGFSTAKTSGGQQCMPRSRAGAEAARDRFLNIMEREAGRMNRLVADLLSLSRVEQDERRRPLQRIDLAGLLRSEVARTTRSWPASRRQR